VNKAIKRCALAAAAVIITMTALASSAGNTYYRWVDDRGNPVHSDRPPAKGVEYEVISTGSTLKRQVSAEEGAVPAEVEPRVGNEFEQVDTADKKLEKNPEFCQRARDNLETLNTAARIRMRNDQGEIRFISEEEKAEQRKTAEANIKAHCE
tara:strand:+ start:10562 stop:11017 length:456 start_codon:yes stop_codon:yes gene_type:complete